jgi:putative spermidine/putrescine transport system ATP-binding protein
MTNSKPSLQPSGGVPISLKGVTKKFGTYTALDKFDMDIRRGEFLTILGESGSGKTTILNSLAGFIEIDSGSILIDGKSVEKLPPERRGAGMVFQNYSLFPHMNVLDNVAFPLRMRGASKQDARTRAGEALEIVRLHGLGQRFPRELSGGQQQRVAVARAISFGPSVLLMDEPLGALDLKLREALQFEIKQIQRQLGCTVVYVTHDQREAMAMSDRIVILRNGKIEQMGSSEELYDRPASKFVADFIGQTNVLPAKVSGGTLSLATLGVTFSPQIQPGSGGTTYLSIRPEKLNIHKTAVERVSFPATITEKIFLGDSIAVSATVADGSTLYCRQPRTKGFSVSVGENVFLAFDPDDAVLIHEDTAGGE